jgi:hypothetical protein
MRLSSFRESATKVDPTTTTRNRTGVGKTDRRENAVFTVNLMLADSAQVAEGKLFILGGGWSHIIPGGPFAVCGIIGIPWHLATDWHKLRMELVDGDDEPVLVPISGPDDLHPFVFEPPPYRPPIAPFVKPGTSLEWPFALNVGVGLPLRTDTTYVWRISIDGGTEDGWNLPFRTLSAPPAMPQAA